MGMRHRSRPPARPYLAPTTTHVRSGWVLLRSQSLTAPSAVGHESPRKWNKMVRQRPVTAAAACCEHASCTVRTDAGRNDAARPGSDVHDRLLVACRAVFDGEQPDRSRAGGRRRRCCLGDRYRRRCGCAGGRRRGHRGGSRQGLLALRSDLGRDELVDESKDELPAHLVRKRVEPLGQGLPRLGDARARGDDVGLGSGQPLGRLVHGRFQPHELQLGLHLRHRIGAAGLLQQPLPLVRQGLELGGRLHAPPVQRLRRNSVRSGAGANDASDS